MTRVTLIAALCCLLTRGVLAEQQARPPEGKRRLNVVLILADDLGWSDLGCYGADLHETPHIDRLASEGVRFTDAYAASVCSPTRACLMTGKHYARLGVTVWREQSQNPPAPPAPTPPIATADLAHQEVTLAEVFQAAGYLTALVGKWHLGAPHYPETQGFEINVGGTHWGAPQSFFYPYRGTGQFGKEFRYVPHLEWGRPGEYLTDRLTDEALKVIDRAGDRPFFLYLAHHAPHTPIEAKTDLVTRYEKRRRPDLHHQNPTYAAMVHSLDESIGRIVDRLRQRNMADHTVIVFLSDNGGYVGEFGKMQVTSNHPLRSGKGSLYEGGVRIPLVVRWPGVTSSNTVCREPIYVADLYPTLLAVAGPAGDAAHKANVDGENLAALFKDPEARLDRDALYFHYPHYYATTTPATAVRAGDWKLLEYHEDNRLELYNLKDDLGEKRDVAAVQPAKARELRDWLRAWRKEVQAGMPAPNPDYKLRSN